MGSSGEQGQIRGLHVAGEALAVEQSWTFGWPVSRSPAARRRDPAPAVEPFCKSLPDRRRSILAAVSRLPPTWPAKVSTTQVKQGTPAHNASLPVVCEPQGSVSRARSAHCRRARCCSCGIFAAMNGRGAFHSPRRRFSAQVLLHEHRTKPFSINRYSMEDQTRADPPLRTSSRQA